MAERRDLREGGQSKQRRRGVQGKEENQYGKEEGTEGGRTVKTAEKRDPREGGESIWRGGEIRGREDSQNGGE